MTLPPGFFFQAVQLMPESEPADFSLSLSPTLSLFHLFLSFSSLGNAPANLQGPEGHLPAQATLASQDAPDGSHSGCSLKSSQLPGLSAHRKKASLHPLLTPLGVNLLKSRFSFAVSWSQANSSLGQLLICHIYRATSRKPIAFFLVFNSTKKASANIVFHYFIKYLSHTLLPLLIAGG